MHDIDKGFNTFRNLIIGFIVLTFLLVIGIWTFYGVVGVKVYNAVEKDGLKSVVEGIWDGPDKSKIDADTYILEEK